VRISSLPSGPEEEEGVFIYVIMEDAVVWLNVPGASDIVMMRRHYLPLRGKCLPGRTFKIWPLLVVPDNDFDEDIALKI
jgi:hypothetical protein